MAFELPELDRKATQAAVERELERYRIFKYLTFEEKEAATTSRLDEIGGGKSNLTSDQTGSVAIYNVDEQSERRKYCDRIERAVKRLPPMERFLIESRYMADDAEYLTDMKVYCFKFQPPISATTYDKIRWKAFYKLALDLNIARTM
ncbi:MULTISPECIES: ArpU family phage packaging/lysis transcriptional regulator [Lysinibacillus]|uniref:ArpU family phage packaging/lysis transcriptional regulator n=1 Tax=Lysinibacillus TaxID=400634 RepID=UPI0004DA1B7E|nr:MULTISPECIES: ArpU family phage packaging/lysis transcriptional regulator [Lysinibacillus]AJK89656.1 transcriptional regulator [Lysinibacillus fusiformis]KHK54308.1 transcriptional regulator [Lysinibacillus sp. A1]